MASRRMRRADLVEEGHLAPVPHPRVVQVVHSRIDVA